VTGGKPGGVPCEALARKIDGLLGDNFARFLGLGP